MLSNALLDKSFLAEALKYASYLMNSLSLTTIGGKTLLGIWSGEAARDYSLLWVFGCPTYFRVKHDELNSRAKNFVFFGDQKKYERLQVMTPKTRRSC